MYDNFVYDTGGFKLAGYIWDVPHPDNVVCIIHGIGEYAGRYDRLAKILNPAGIAVLSMDLPGHGLSVGKRGHAAPRSLVLDDVTVMIRYAEEKWPGIPITLYGHSMGGNICLDYRARGELNDIPSRYIVSAPWIKLVRNVSGTMYRVLRFFARRFPEFQINDGCSYMDLGNIDIIKSYAADPLVHKYITLECAVECFDIGNSIMMCRNVTNRRADGIPLLLMHGSDDRICSVEGSRSLAAMLEGKDRFTYIEWPGYYHEIHNGGPDADGMKVMETIRDFVKGEAR